MIDRAGKPGIPVIDLARISAFIPVGRSAAHLLPGHLIAKTFGGYISQSRAHHYHWKPYDSTLNRQASSGGNRLSDPAVVAKLDPLDKGGGFLLKRHW